MESSAVQSFDIVATELSNMLRQKGIEISALHKSRPLRQRTEDHQRQAIERAGRQLQQMEITEGVLEEFEKFRILCHYHKVQPADPKVFTHITRNSAWEILDFNMNQLYRNDMLFKLGNYSIEEYEAYSPWELFNRPQYVLGSLAETTIKLKQDKRMLSLEHIPSYVIEETLSEQRGQYRIKHTFACPLVCNSTNENTMFVSMFQAETLDPQRRVSIL
ncbi:hypothetical protein [Bdellovibrio sp. HCB209]|uniref:hypothetical protein n=1 Tax=Bdellovibrio sp. HCB209 TaxID=3394354 RepID=UPI0039B508A4